MKLKPSSIGPKPEPLDLENLQNRCGKLPADFIKFLKKTNGGAFEEYRYVSVPGGETVAVDVVLGLGKGTLYDILDWLKNKDVPRGYFAVAVAPNGSPFVISTVDKVKGIYYWDDELFFDKSEEDAHAYFVAPTFSEFLDMLMPTFEEAEEDLAASDHASEPVSLVEEEKLTVVRPKFKGDLDAKLDQASLLFKKLYHAGKCSDPLAAAKTGFGLSEDLDEWDETGTNLVNGRVNKLNEQPSVAELCNSNQNVLLLYAYLTGFVSGQFAADEIRIKDYAYSQKNVVEAVVRNHGLVPIAS